MCPSTWLSDFNTPHSPYDGIHPACACHPHQTDNKHFKMQELILLVISLSAPLDWLQTFVFIFVFVSFLHGQESKFTKLQIIDRFIL